MIDHLITCVINTDRTGDNDEDKAIVYQMPLR